MQSPELESSAQSSNHRFRRITGEFLRFLIMGGINTLVAYLVYLILLILMRYEIAYAIGYAVGICFAYALSATFVFRKPMNRRSAIQFPLVYLAQFLLSLGLLKVAVDWLDIPKWLAFILVVALTVPVTFTLTRRVLHAG